MKWSIIKSWSVIFGQEIKTELKVDEENTVIEWNNNQYIKNSIFKTNLWNTLKNSVWNIGQELWCIPVITALRETEPWQ